MTEPRRTPYSGEGVDLYFGEYTGTGEKDGMWRMRLTDAEHEVSIDYTRAQMWEWVETLGHCLKADDIVDIARESRKTGR